MSMYDDVEGIYLQGYSAIPGVENRCYPIRCIIHEKYNGLYYYKKDKKVFKVEKLVSDSWLLCPCKYWSKKVEISVNIYWC